MKHLLYNFLLAAGLTVLGGLSTAVSSGGDSEDDALKSTERPGSPIVVPAGSGELLSAVEAVSLPVGSSSPASAASGDAPLEVLPTVSPPSATGGVPSPSLQAEPELGSGGGGGGGSSAVAPLTSCGASGGDPSEVAVSPEVAAVMQMLLRAEGEGGGTNPAVRRVHAALAVVRARHHHGDLVVALRRGDAYREILEAWAAYYRACFEHMAGSEVAAWEATDGSNFYPVSAIQAACASVIASALPRPSRPPQPRLVVVWDSARSQGIHTLVLMHSSHVRGGVVMVSSTFWGGPTIFVDPFSNGSPTVVPPTFPTPEQYAGLLLAFPSRVSASPNSIGTIVADPAAAIAAAGERAASRPEVMQPLLADLPANVLGPDGILRPSRLDEGGKDRFLAELTSSRRRDLRMRVVWGANNTMVVHVLAPWFAPGITLSPTDTAISSAILHLAYTASARIAVARSAGTGGPVPFHISLVGGGTGNAQAVPGAFRSALDAVVNSRGVTTHVHPRTRMEVDIIQQVAAAAGFEVVFMTPAQFLALPSAVVVATDDSSCAAACAAAAASGAAAAPIAAVPASSTSGVVGGAAAAGRDASAADAERDAAAVGGAANAAADDDGADADDDTSRADSSAPAADAPPAAPRADTPANVGAGDPEDSTSSDDDRASSSESE